MATKLTPATLRRIVLEEKKKIEKQMLDKRALSELELEMEEGDWSAPPPHAVKQTPGKRLATLRMINEAEARLLRQLRVIQERRLALRKQILRDV